MRGRKKKLPFEDLDSDFKDTVANFGDADIKNKLADIAIAEHENLEAKKQDKELEEAKEKYHMSGEIYREASKANRLRTRYCYHILEARGKV